MANAAISFAFDATGTSIALKGLRAARLAGRLSAHATRLATYRASMHFLNEGMGMLGIAATGAAVDAGIVTPIGGLYEAGIGGDVSWVDFAPVPWLGTFDDILDWGTCLAGGS